MSRHRLTESMIDLYKQYLVNEEKSQATVEKYIRDLKAFLAYCREMEADVDKRIVMAYKEHLKQFYKPGSINSMLASVNCFLKFMGWQECCVRPLKIQKTIFSQEDRVLRKEEYLRLLKAAKEKKNQRLYMIMETLGSTGMRVSELTYVTVEALKQRQAVITCKGKIRKILLPDKLCRELGRYIKTMNIKSGCIFITKSGKAMNRSNIWTAMKKLCREAAVDEMEKDIAKLADILGHSCVDTTRIYIVTDGMQHRKQLERLNMILE